MLSHHLSKTKFLGIRSYNTLLERQTTHLPINMDTTALINWFEWLNLTSGGLLGLPGQIMIT